MSVLVPSLPPHHHNSRYLSNNNNNNSNRCINKNYSQMKTNKLNDNEQNKDQVPYGVVNSMKQRLFNKVNEKFFLNNNNNHNNSTLTRHLLSKPLTRLSSNENLLQTKNYLTPIKNFTRLSRSQDNLTNNHSITTEQFTSYIQPKQDVIIVETSSINNDDIEGKLHSGHKTSIHRQSYTELHVDEAPKPGTVTTVKNMFERQIRLSRYDADKLLNSSTPGSSRVSSQHREISSPIRSRSISPNDLTLKQKRIINSTTTSSSSSTTLLLPIQTSYPDLVISHTPPIETTNKNLNEQIYNENFLINNQGINKEQKKIFLTNRSTTTIIHEHLPLNVLIDDNNNSLNLINNQNHPNLLLPSTISSETIDSQPLDFKSRLALFNRTNENCLNNKKIFNQTNSSITKSVSYHQPIRSINEEKKDYQYENLHKQFSHSVINTAKAVTFFGGNKLNGETNSSSLPNSISFPSTLQKSTDQSSISSTNDLLRAPDIIGGNVKLNKSSMFSGIKKDVRVQFHDNIDTFEYPSFELVMAELGSTGSDNDDLSSTSSNDDNNKNLMNININSKHEKLINDDDNNDQHIDDDVDDDELEKLARINAKFNTNNLSENSLKPKGTLHTFRPTHLDQYELGGTLSNSNPSDILNSKNSYTILARQKLLISSDTSTKPSIYKQQKSSTFDISNNIQWSSMSTTTDLLF